MTKPKTKILNMERIDKTLEKIQHGVERLPLREQIEVYRGYTVGILLTMVAHSKAFPEAPEDAINQAIRHMKAIISTTFVEIKDNQDNVADFAKDHRDQLTKKISRKPDESIH